MTAPREPAANRLQVVLDCGSEGAVVRLKGAATLDEADSLRDHLLAVELQDDVAGARQFRPVENIDRAFQRKLRKDRGGRFEILLVELRDDVSIVLIEQFDQQDRIDVVARHVVDFFHGSPRDPPSKRTVASRPNGQTTGRDGRGVRQLLSLDKGWVPSNSRHRGHRVPLRSHGPIRMTCQGEIEIVSVRWVLASGIENGACPGSRNR